MCVYMCVCVHACVRARACTCLRSRTRVFLLTYSIKSLFWNSENQLWSQHKRTKFTFFMIPKNAVFFSKLRIIICYKNHNNIQLKMCRCLKFQLANKTCMEAYRACCGKCQPRRRWECRCSAANSDQTGSPPLGTSVGAAQRTHREIKSASKLNNQKEFISA